VVGRAALPASECRGNAVAEMSGARARRPREASARGRCDGATLVTPYRLRLGRKSAQTALLIFIPHRYTPPRFGDNECLQLRWRRPAAGASFLQTSWFRLLVSLRWFANCEFRCVPDRGKPALPSLLGRGNISLDSVVHGSATPVGASQWSFFTGGRTFVSGSRGYIGRAAPSCAAKPRGQATRRQSAGKGKTGMRLGRVPASFCAW